ncbi:MAG: hypothetical protein LBG52_05815, partial [Candidatus Peribacteria bacterium]|nr:hypothetical protein [Candidatus Peribacteria bacterium]
MFALGQDDVCGSFSASKSMTTTIVSNTSSSSSTGGPQSLYLYKTSKASYLLTKQMLEYQMIIQNIGSVVTSEVYV